MKKILWIFIALGYSFIGFAQQQKTTATVEDYRYKVNITKVYDDKVEVELLVPKSAKTGKVAIFNFPKTIPGTYSIQNYGRFITNFKVFDKNGKPFKSTWIKHNRMKKNTWEIKKPKKIHKIVYTVEDTWDTDKDKKFSNDYIFEPAGTNIEKDRNFVFNNSGFFGYFDGAKRVPYFIEVDRQKDFFGATSLERVGGDEDTDIFVAANYNDLVDAPIMFNRPDVTTVKVGNADVLISVYSPTGKVKSSFIAGEIEPILQAQKEYLGGDLPVDKYAFIIYLSEDSKTSSGGFGALEHSYSSVYFLPEAAPEAIAQMVRDVAAHEFFHIVTPLNIHSEQIHNFDFIDPQMSEHLWMYEGVTEYSAGHVQVKYGLLTIQEYLDVLAGKMRNATNYDESISFTEMSSKCLEEHKEQYNNVYEKGALIGMCLDIRLRQLSDGNMGVQELMQALSKEYGKNQAFEDKDLFAKITELTYPEIADFFKNYVAGTQPLPIQELTAAAGISYFDAKEVKELSPLGGLSDKNIGYDGKTFFVKSLEGLDAFATDMIGFKVGDKIMKWNDKDLNLQSINEVLGLHYEMAKEGDDLTIAVEREGKMIDLETKMSKVDVMREFVFEVNPNATSEQLKLRKAWLGDYKSE